MKKYLMILVTLLTMSGSAANSLYIDNFMMNGNETKTVSVMMDNETTFSAVQCDFTLPNGLTITNIEKTTRCRNHTVTSNVLADGTVRVWLSSMSSRTISGNSGELLILTLKSSSGFSGQQQLLISNIIGAHETNDSGGERVEMPDYTCFINNLVLGDLTGDGKIDVEDVNAAVNIILKLKSVNDYPGSADMNGDRIIDVEDVNALVNIILKLV